MKDSSRLERLTNRRRNRKKRKEKRKIRTSASFTKFLKATLGRFLVWKFNVKNGDMKVFDGLKPPYFVISTHNSFWGPFFVAFFVPHPVSFVVSDANFRHPLMNWGLSLVGAIPKTKVLSDMDTIKNILDIKNRKGVIGLYPEGQNSYDGHSLPVFYSTAKLLKRLKIPVVVADKNGSYLTYPRWAKSVRRGKVVLSYRMGFTPEELDALSVDEIFNRLEKYLTYDEYDFQRKAMIPYKGKDRAEYLEIVLFTCPDCRDMGKLVSHGNDFTCSECGYSVHYNEYGLFDVISGKLHFSTIRDWNEWQLSFLREKLEKLLAGEKDSLILEDSGMNIHVGYKTDPMQLSGTGTMRLYGSNLLFLDDDGESLDFSLKEIIGVNMHNDEKLEFYYRDSLFRFDNPNKRISLYKWYLGIKYIQEEKAKSQSA